MEIVVIIAIMGVLLTVGVGAWYRGVDSDRATTAANQLAADLRLAHSSATNQLADYYVVYNANGSAATNCSNADCCPVKRTTSGSEKTPRDLPKGTSIISTDLGDETLIATLLGLSGKAVKFKSDGQAEAKGGLIFGSETKITVGVPDSQRHEVEVTPSTSKAKEKKVS